MALTDDQRQKIRDYLHREGLSFKPLQDEMVDHMACDLELCMAEGHSFDKALLQVTNGIGENHFQQIQMEIMETINKRFTWSQGLSFLALGLLLISTLFKVLHLQFAGELLILSFVLIAASLLTTALTGVFLNRGKHGATRVLAVIVGILFMLVGYAFRFLHLPGADQLIVFAVCILIVSFVTNAIYVYRNSSGRSNLLTYLHEKYTQGIERFFLILLLPMIAYNLMLIFQGSDAPRVNFILLVVIFGSGLQFIAMCWRTMEQNHTRRNRLVLVSTIMSSVCLSIPFLGPLVPLEFRIVVIVLFTTSGWLAYTLEEEPRIISLILVCMVPLIFTGWALVWLKVIPATSSSIFFNIPVLLILTTGLLPTRKHGIMRAYMLISVASYVFEYVV